MGEDLVSPREPPWHPERIDHLTDAVHERAVHLPNGRTVTLLDSGASAGPSVPTVVALHGTPGSRLAWRPMIESAARIGVRLVAPDRPGFGGSTPQPVSSVDAYPGELAALADTLGVERFAVLGWSGGAPFALAAAALLPGRVVAAATVGGVGPPDRPGAHRGVAPAERVLDLLAQRARPVARAAFATSAHVVRRLPGPTAKALAAALPAADRATVRRLPGGARALLDDYLEGHRQGAQAVADEYAALGSPWSQLLAAVAAPVHVFHGDADRAVPFHHATYLADRLPRAMLHRWPGEGHLALYDHAEEILTALASAA